MSIEILGMHANNKIWVDNSYEEIAKFTKEFKPILVSYFSDSIFLKDADIIKGRQLLFLLKTINNFLPKNIICKVNSGKRTKYINKKVKGARLSQHPFWEALDLHFYIDGKRIYSKEVLKGFYKLIIELLSDALQQVILYPTFVHIGLATSRRKVTKRRNIKLG